MDVPARFKWKREKDHYAAYPVGNLTPERKVTLWPYTATNMWRWAAIWPGWFSFEGTSEQKQDAADKATEAWWAGVQTEIPRDTEAEIAVIAARVLVRPPPNSLFAETGPFLRGLMHSLKLQYQEELAAGKLPPPVENLMANLSAELYRRRLAGESEDQDIGHRWTTT